MTPAVRGKQPSSDLCHGSWRCILVALRKEGGRAPLEKPSPSQPSHMWFPQETWRGRGWGGGFCGMFNSFIPFSYSSNFTLPSKPDFETSVSATSEYRRAFSRKRSMVAEVLTGQMRTSGRVWLCLLCSGFWTVIPACVAVTALLRSVIFSCKLYLSDK